MTDADAVLRIADLRRACSMLLDAAESRFGPEIQLSQLGVDHYWDMDLGAAFGMVQRPELEIDCGQSSDEVAELTSLLQRGGPEGFVSLWHDLSHVSGLLRLLAYLDLPDNRDAPEKCDAAR
ncbi:hypothetical protein ACQPZK_23355 [Micromonospora sp. CA-249363]|uniref:hypothetical protein n=1 Tax=Micromonospora sp. CA-249363 TaxID=3239963 RepID=UPI003D9407B3